MRAKLAVCVSLTALGLFASTTMAWPKESKSAADQAQTATKAGADLPCAHKCIPPCDPANCDHRCDPAKCGRSAAGDKVAMAVASRTDDGRSEPAEGHKKGGCSKPCGGKKAALTADTPEKQPCSGHKATTVADVSDDPPCHAKGAAATAHDSKGCGKGCCKKVEAILASLPAMSYRVDGEVTRCSKSAASMAEKTHKPIEYVVGEEVMTDKGEATAKLVSLLDKEAESLQSMQFVAGGKCHRCPMTAKSVAQKSNTTVAYRVGGVDFDGKEDAEKALEAIHAAAAAVKVSYKVDGKTYGCDKTAGAQAKETGKEMVYVVGDEETCCEKTAKLKLTEAKIRKIVETAVATAAGSTSSPS